MVEQAVYKVNLEVFEGPLDLLLHLIKRNDLDIYDIPISFILEEYIKYLDVMEELDIDLAGEFLLMASELTYIKSQMLLPDEGGLQDQDEPDPREDLVERLLEYQRYKEGALGLDALHQLGRDIFDPLNPSDELGGEGEVSSTADVFQLIEAFSNMLKKVPEKGFHNVVVDRISVSERVYQIMDIFKSKQIVLLDELIGGDFTRSNVLVNFLAILEMSRLKMVTLFQSSIGGQIHVKQTMQEVAEDEVKRIAAEGASFK